MNRKLIGNIARFILLVIAQVYMFNNIQVSGFISPQVYVLFILMLPYEIAGFWLLTLAFGMGLTVDFFMHTPGLNATACVLMAFMRPGVIKLVGKKDDVEPWHYPNIRDSGTMWFLAYMMILVFFHHLVLYMLEAARFSEIFQTLLKVLINTVLSSLIIMLLQFLFYSRKAE